MFKDYIILKFLTSFLILIRVSEGGGKLMKHKSIFDTGFFEFLETEEEFIVNGETKLVKRDMVRRSPGVRALIVDNGRILLSKEYRYELQKWDYRLPGGKVFDSLKEYKRALENDTVLEAAEKTVRKEAKEEVGINIKNQTLFKISAAGARVIWDLYYYEVTDYEIVEDGQRLEENEFVEGFVWKTFDEIKEMCIKQEISEDRSVGVILTYILKHEGKE